MQCQASMGEELCSVKDNNTRSELAFLISRRHLSVRKVRQIVEDLEKDVKHSSNFTLSKSDDKHNSQTQRSLDKSIIVLRIALNRIAMIIEDVKDDYWVTGEILLQHKNVLHGQIDILMKERRKTNERLERILR